MKKWFPKPPKGISCMSMSACGRYVYALTQTVYVLDRETGEKQRLPQLGNSEPVPSPCGRFMAAAHPCRTAATQLEVSIWQAGPEHRELFPRVRVPSDIPPFHPCFTADGAYFLLDAHPAQQRNQRRQNQLWAVSTADGIARMVYDVPEKLHIRSITAGERGVLLALQGWPAAGGRKDECRLVWLRDVNAPPVEIPFDAAPPEHGVPLHNRDLSATWLPDGRILLAWSGRDAALQWISPETERITPAAEQMLPWSFGPLGAQFSPDGRYAVVTNIINGHFSPQVGDERPAAMVFRTSDWTLVWHRNTRFLWDARFSLDGRFLLISGDEAWCIPAAELEGNK